jgi:hypothetical protein
MANMGSVWPADEATPYFCFEIGKLHSMKPYLPSVFTDWADPKTHHGVHKTAWLIGDAQRAGAST